MKITRSKLTKIIQEELAYISEAAAGPQEVTPEELEEFRSADVSGRGVGQASREELAMAYAADFLDDHRVLGMYQNNIWFEDSSGKIYRIGRLG
jgi:hypothetical protein